MCFRTLSRWSGSNWAWNFLKNFKENFFRNVSLRYLMSWSVLELGSVQSSSMTRSGYALSFL